MKKKSAALILGLTLLFSNMLTAQISQDAQLQSRYYFGSFTKGQVVFKDGNVYQYPLNYDLLMKEIVFSPAENEVMALAEPLKVKFVEIDNHMFVQKNGLFYELIVSDSISLLAFYRLNVSADKVGAYGMVSQSAAIDTYKSVEMQTRTVDLKPNVRISELKSTVYYFLINGKLKQISNPKDIYKLFPKLATEIKQLIENHELSFKEQKSLIEIVEFINQKIK